MAHTHTHHLQSKPAPGSNLATDPVCGMTVDPHTAKYRADYAGRPYYFCSARCRTKFLAAPKRYLASKEGEVPPPPVPEGTVYTCPMHPEIRQIGPGSCPICGMALEPVMATAQTGPNPELVDMSRRFWIGLALTVPVVTLEMGTHLLGLDHAIVIAAITSRFCVVAQLNRRCGIRLDQLPESCPPLYVSVRLRSCPWRCRRLNAKTKEQWRQNAMSATR